MTQGPSGILQVQYLSKASKAEVCSLGSTVIAVFAVRTTVKYSKEPDGDDRICCQEKDSLVDNSLLKEARNKEWADSSQLKFLIGLAPNSLAYFKFI